MVLLADSKQSQLPANGIIIGDTQSATYAY